MGIVALRLPLVSARFGVVVWDISLGFGHVALVAWAFYFCDLSFGGFRMEAFAPKLSFGNCRSEEILLRASGFELSHRSGNVLRWGFL